MVKMSSKKRKALKSIETGQPTAEAEVITKPGGVKVTKSTQPASLERLIPKLLIFSGVVGLIAAFIISYDKLELLKNPSFSPNCDINPIISCGSVMKSWQGSVFGFPNPWIGLVAFGILLTVGMGLLAGARYKRWFWIGLQLGTVFGVGFVHWLFFQSVYSIHALCPYCMAVWAVVIPTFWYVLLYNLEQRHIVLPARFEKASRFMRRHHLDILLFWYLVIIALILKQFWFFFGRPFGA